MAKQLILPPVDESENRLKELEVYANSIRNWDGQIKYEGRLILSIIELVKKLRDAKAATP